MAVASKDLWPKVAEAIGLEGESVISCSIHFDIDSTVRVDVEMHVADESINALVPVLREFELVAVSDPDDELRSASLMQKLRGRLFP